MRQRTRKPATLLSLIRQRGYRVSVIVVCVAVLPWAQIEADNARGIDRGARAILNAARVAQSNQEIRALEAGKPVEVGVRRNEKGKRKKYHESFIAFLPI